VGRRLRVGVPRASHRRHRQYEPLTWVPEAVSDEPGVLVPLIVGLDDAVSDDDSDAELVAV
jgi:hypothetical protein